MADKELAREILDRQSELETERADYEAVWEAVAKFCDADGPTTNWSPRIGTTGSGSQASRAEERGRLVYDNTIASATDRLAAGLESLITPQSEMWHGLSTAAMNDEETDEEREWAEGLRDFLFNDIRYQSASNFVPMEQAVYQNVVKYGPAYGFPEEGFGSTHIRYSSIPVHEAFIARDKLGEPDVFHRLYELTVRQIVQKFGWSRLPAKIKDLHDKNSLEKLTLLQCVKPKRERQGYDLDGNRFYLDMPYASYHVLCDEEEVIKESGFLTFPVACFNWRRQEGDTYGISPTIKALTTVREINAVRRSALRALQQVTDPPTASIAKLDYVPVLNPGTNYPGLVDDAGRLLIQPISVAQNPQYAFEYAGQRAEEIKDMLYVNLFQVLVSNPDMTATEALIRQEEKGALLGPAGSVIQRGFAALNDRELSILEAKGLYAPGSRFQPPQSLAGKQIRVTFTSPLDVLRKAAEAKDTLSLLQTAAQLATFDPGVMDNIDTDEAIKVIKGAGRAPQRVLRRREEVDAIRDARAQAQKAQAGAATIANMAPVAKDLASAAKTAGEAGLLAGLPVAGNA
jgi:hypothetical protein